jgi:hypothetical protein
MDMVLSSPQDDARIEEARQKILALSGEYPLYPEFTEPWPC